MKKNSNKTLNIIILITILILALLYVQLNGKKERRKVIATAKEAYIFGYPLVLMDITKDIGTNVKRPTMMLAPINQIGHLKRFPDHTFKEVVRPNVDTFYSSAFIDLKKEPIVLDIAGTKGRYFVLQFMNAYSDVFFAPGSRTTGTKKQRYIIAGPEWEGKGLRGVKTIKSSTNLVWMIGRTQVNSPEDGEEFVSKIQDGYKITPLSKIDTNYKPPRGKVRRGISKRPPVFQIAEMDIETFFNRMNKLLADNPHSDRMAKKKFRKIKVCAGKKFSLKEFDEETARELRKIPKMVHAEFREKAKSFGRNINGWRVNLNLGSYGRNYDLRATTAFAGFGANLPQDAVYPFGIVDSKGRKLDSKEKYVIHFEADNLPPVNAFWSITMYDKNQFLADNTIDRYAIGDRDDLKYNEDGSLDIYIQRLAPRTHYVSNWLPTPKEGRFDLILRMYWPKDKVLRGQYKIPPIEKVE